GKPHDGLGYVPEVMEHLHGSTGIGGIAVYDDVRFPEVYQGNVFGGNVMTGRVNRNSLQRIGSTLRAVEEPDFLIAGDPWFRPVDLQLGPDGALYVADFYNRIIGHYEVDLDHPGRDRHRGRIWKISYTGDSTLSERRDTKLKPHQPEPSHSSHQVQSIDEALVGLSDRNLTRQLLAANRIVDEYPGIAQQRIRPLLLDADPNLRLQAGWILHRLHMLQQTELASLIEDTNNLVRTHGFRILESDIGKQEHLQPSNHGPWIIQGLQDSAAMVQRAATMASITKPKQEFIAYILEAFTSTPITDKHLRHTLRMSLRTHLQNEAWFSELVPNLQEEEQRVAVLGVCLGIQSSVAARFVLDQLPLIGQAYPEELESYIAFAAKYVTPEDLNQLSQLVRNQFATDADYQERILRAALDGITPANSGEIPGPLRDWAKELALGRFGMKPGSDSPRFRKGQIPIAWSFHRYPDENEQEVENCWQFSTKRSSSDGEMNSLLFSSFPLGEKRRGIYRSAAFDLPADFSFFMAGHDGFPDKPIQRQNFVRLRDSSSQAGLALWRPPRNDTAQLFTLESPKLAGRSVYLELVDGDSAGAYAWLAVGRFSVAGLNPSETLADWRIAAELVRDFRLFALRPVVTELIMNSVQDPATSQMMAEAILATTRQRASAYQRALAICLGFPRVHGELRRRVLTELFDTSQGKGRLLDEISPLCTEVQQRHIATLLAEDRQGADHLLRLLESGKFATRLLLDAEILAKLKTRLSREQTERLSLLEGSIPKMQRRTRAAYERRIKELRSGLDAGLGNAADGRALFRKQCASCHRIGDEGKQVGPNLDGIGNRGLTRLTEDIFFPNRNVDVAFRATSILTHDDRVLSGLLRQTVDDQISLTDSQGTITRISANAIASRKQLLQSPMPGNFLETLSTQQSQDLFAFLLSLSQ
ncbi:MAG: c-type cytochrome, partial [Planctomycetota bacterium]